MHKCIKTGLIKRKKKRKNRVTIVCSIRNCRYSPCISNVRIQLAKISFNQIHKYYCIVHLEIAITDPIHVYVTRCGYSFCFLNPEWMTRFRNHGDNFLQNVFSIYDVTMCVYSCDMQLKIRGFAVKVAKMKVSH